MHTAYTWHHMLCLHPYKEMLLDLLVHPEGPKLRAKVSHGEVSKVLERSQSSS